MRIWKKMPLPAEKFVCTRCQNKEHDECESRLKCECDCNINGLVDVAEKTLVTAAGVGAVVCGLVLTIGSGGFLAIPIGGALIGAGFSSTIKGITKSVKKERIKACDLAFDVCFGAVTGKLNLLKKFKLNCLFVKWEYLKGLATGGISGASEVAVSSVVKEGGKHIVCAVVKAGAGAVAGTAVKAIDEVS